MVDYLRTSEVAESEMILTEHEVRTDIAKKQKVPTTQWSQREYNSDKRKRTLQIMIRFYCKIQANSTIPTLQTAMSMWSIN